MEFREVAPGRLWPPIIPEGTAYGCSQIAPGKLMELFKIKPEGIFCAGANYAWGDLGSISTINDTIWIHSEKYSSGGLRFKEHPFYLIDPFGERFDYIHGYRAAWCLVNRAADCWECLGVKLCREAEDCLGKCRAILHNRQEAAKMDHSGPTKPRNIHEAMRLDPAYLGLVNRLSMPTKHSGNRRGEFEEAIQDQIFTPIGLVNFKTKAWLLFNFLKFSTVFMLIHEGRLNALLLRKHAISHLAIGPTKGTQSIKLASR